MAKANGFDGTSENMAAYAIIVNGIQWKAPHMQINEKLWIEGGFWKNHVYMK
jgi:hypothetical protein